MAAADIRDDLLDTLTHVASAFRKLVAASGNGKTKVLSFPDLHKSTEGLFLNAWTYWEQFLRRTLIGDLATDANGVLRKEVKNFRTKSAPKRLAELVLEHPDDGKWVEWSSLDQVKTRADTVLGAGHRFSTLVQADLVPVRSLKKIRNAIAHKSDSAWAEFKKTATSAPYNLQQNSLKGITTGRFLAAHNVGTVPIFSHAVTTLETTARKLVP